MTTFLSPMDLAPATQAGRHVFRKQILKKGVINYRGQKVKFDDDFLKDVVRSFKRGAYDQVPFVFADPENRHNMDPERFRGEVKGLEMTPDGLDMIVEATEDGAKVIKNNPRLGVSARIVQGLEKSDGRVYRRAIQHVLATMDPRLTGMRSWEAVDLSDDDDDEEVIDLTAATVKEGKPVGKQTRKNAATQVVQIDLSQLEDGAFKDLLLAAAAEAENDSDTDTEEVTRTTRETVKRRTPKQRQPVDVDPDLDEDDEDLEDDELEEDDEAEASVGPDGEEVDEDELDEEDDEEEEKPRAKKRKKAVKLSTPVRRQKVSKARRLELKLAAQEWHAAKGDLVRAGVPPFLLDLAEPVMAQPDRLVIDLSETGERDVDAKAVIGRMLDGVKGMIDLAPEMGHGISEVPDDKNDPTRKALSAWEKEYGKP